MENQELPEPRDRILQSAALLFANKGYSVIGVREIASAADVNVSMISYYYGGKMGILKEIIRQYYSMMQEKIREVNSLGLPYEQHTKAFIKKLVGMIRENTSLCKVALVEMAIDEPEVEEFKIEMIKQHIEFIKTSVNSVNSPCPLPDFRLHSIMGPAMLGLVYSNFLIGHVSKKILNIEFNDEYFEYYSNVVSDIFLYGITGLSEKYNKLMNANNSGAENDI